VRTKKFFLAGLCSSLSLWKFGFSSLLRFCCFLLHPTFNSTGCGHGVVLVLEAGKSSQVHLIHLLLWFCLVWWCDGGDTVTAVAKLRRVVEKVETYFWEDMWEKRFWVLSLSLPLSLFLSHFIFAHSQCKAIYSNWQQVSFAHSYYSCVPALLPGFCGFTCRHLIFNQPSIVTLAFVNAWMLHGTLR